MSDRLNIGPRLAFAMCCVALVCVMLAQGAVSRLDQFQHALGVEHAPNVFAGGFRIDTGAGADHDAADHHHHADDDHHAEDDHDDDHSRGDPGRSHSGPLGHTHFADGGHTLLASANFVDFKPEVHVGALSWSVHGGRPLLIGARLDRPPKPALISIA